MVSKKIKTMKKQRFTTAFIFAVAICFGFSGCGSDDDELDVQSPYEQDDTQPGGGQDGESDDTEGAGNGRGPVAEYFIGNGTQADPYVIATAADLRKLSDDVAAGMTYRDEYFRMENDIVINQNVLTADGMLNGDGSGFEQWIPIGNENTPFCGTFDGAGHDIKGIYINDDSGEYKHFGLFGWCAGTITNLNVKDSYLKGLGRIGGIVAIADTRSYGRDDYYHFEMVRCRNYATIEANEDAGYIGGCVGSSVGTSCGVNYCANHGRLTGRVVGGIVGDARSTDITNCYNKGYLSGTCVGGIAGYIYKSTPTIENCFNSGIVRTFDEKMCGGICELAMNTKIRNCVNYGEALDESGKSNAVAYKIMEKSTTSNLFYLETSGISTWGTSKTSKQMKDGAFLATLNSYASSLGAGYDKWVFGKDGYPVLEWSEE